MRRFSRHVLKPSKCFCLASILERVIARRSQILKFLDARGPSAKACELLLHYSVINHLTDERRQRTNVSSDHVTARCSDSSESRSPADKWIEYEVPGSVNVSMTARAPASARTARDSDKLSETVDR